jgi:hypothetical protein
VLVGLPSGGEALLLAESLSVADFVSAMHDVKNGELKATGKVIDTITDTQVEYYGLTRATFPNRRPTAGSCCCCPIRNSVVQRVVDHSYAGVAQRVDRMHESRVTAVRAGLLRPVRRRERQMMAGLAPDDVEGAHPIEQPEIDRRGGGGRQNSDDSDGESLFERHMCPPPTTVDGRLGRYARKL